MAGAAYHRHGMGRVGDESPSGELDGVKSEQFKPVIDACTLCDMSQRIVSMSGTFYGT